MDPITLTLAAMGAMGDAGVSMFGSLLGYASAQGANDTNLKIARENRKWMEKMSNTAHQREVKDLREAGLNPILSAGNLAGASTPAASTDANQRAFTDWNLDKPFSKALKFASSAVGIKNTDADTDLKIEQANQAASAAEANQASANLDKAKTLTEAHNAAIRKIDSDFHAQKTTLGLERAEQKKRSETAKADVDYADAMYRLSDEGDELHRMSAYSNVWRGHGAVSAPALVENFMRTSTSSKEYKRFRDFVRSRTRLLNVKPYDLNDKSTLPVTDYEYR